MNGKKLVEISRRRYFKNERVEDTRVEGVIRNLDELFGFGVGLFDIDIALHRTSYNVVNIENHLYI